jgi:magnesium-transporting ATPase (P-type)
LTTENIEGTAYLETSTLDGEKHLKPRYCPKETLHCIDRA